MTFLIYVIADIIHIISIFLLSKLFVKYNLRENFNSKTIWSIIGAIIMALSMVIYLIKDATTETIIYAIVLVVIQCIIFEEKKLVVIVSALWIMIIVGMIETMAIILFELLGTIMKYTNTDVLKLSAAVLTLLFVVILGRLYNKKYSKGIRVIGLWNLLAFTVLTFIDTFIVMVLALVTRVEERVTNQIIFFIAFILVIVGLFIQLGAVILILVQRNVYKEGQQLTEKYLEEQKSHYEYLEQRELETKKFRHDLRSHMQMLSALARERRYDEFDKYVEEINMNIDRFGNNVTVQNGIVDAIINKYYSEAIANDIKMEVKGRFPSDCVIDAYDLCTIFSNVLSNALEATVESDDKWISVECRYTENNIIVMVKNTFDSNNQLRNGKTKTHKKDVNNHGFGLENVKDSIKKYNGMWDIDIEENVYAITISFNYARLEGCYENSNS